MLSNYYKAGFIIGAQTTVHLVVHTNNPTTLNVPPSKAHLREKPMQLYNGQSGNFRIVVARNSSFDSVLNAVLVVFWFKDQNTRYLPRQSA